ncbi:hypothetical protein [Ostreiculturibacter nitratireducens]|uniref:hypothetical protein n=1 Tax=Ostreiculturibacter nitratireducens TaxID=3075226 RepID=UPI0031B62137
MELKQADPKGLIRESYAIEGISAPECRSIFLDWALSIPPGTDTRAAITLLLDHYGAGKDAHPMTDTLRRGLDEIPEARRRGGRAARFRQQG